MTSAVSTDPLDFVNGIKGHDSSSLHQKGQDVVRPFAPQESPGRRLWWLYENLGGARFARAERNQERRKR